MNASKLSQQPPTKDIDMNDHRRIASLEKRIRRQGLALAGLGIGLIVTVLMGMAHQTPRDMKLENLLLTRAGV